MTEVATMRCEEIREMLPSYAKGEDSLMVRRHLARCSGCQGELDRYGALSQALASLRTTHVEPPRGLLAALIAIPNEANRLEAVRTHVARNKRTYAGVAVAIVGAAGAAAWRTRRRVATA